MNVELAKLESTKLEQMQLTLEGEELYVDRDELPCRYTAEKFKAYYPERYRCAVKLLAAGFSEGEIAKFVHADYRTIRQVAIRCIKDIDDAREIVQKNKQIKMVYTAIGGGSAGADPFAPSGGGDCNPFRPNMARLPAIDPGAFLPRKR